MSRYRLLALAGELESLLSQSFKAADMFERVDPSRDGILAKIGRSFFDNGSTEMRERAAERLWDISSFSMGAMGGIVDQLEEEFYSSGLDGRAIRNRIYSEIRRIQRDSDLDDREKATQLCGYISSYVRSEISKAPF